MARSKAAKTRTRGIAARPGKGAPAAVPTRSAQRVGIELDGGVAHIVSVGGDGTVQYFRLEGQSNATVLNDVLKRAGRGDSVRVALTSAQQSVRRLEIANVPDHVVPIAMREVAQEHLSMGGSDIAVAGLQSQTAGTNGPVMTIAAVSGDESSPLLRQLSPAQPMVVSSFLLPADGLYLRVARSTAELVLVRDGAPSAVRTLRSGGVLSVVHDLDQQSGNMIVGASSGNAAVDAYIDDVVADVRRTIVFWRREGMNVPDQLTIIGEGAGLPALTGRLREASYEVIPVPAPHGLNFDQVRPEDRPVAFQALAAALMDLQAYPFAGLMDAEATTPAVTQKRNPLPIIVAAGCGVVILMMLAYGAFLKVQADLRLSAAKSDLETSQAQLANLGQYTKLYNNVTTGESQVAAIKSAEPRSPDIIRSLLGAAPESARIESFSYKRPDASVFGTPEGGQSLSPAFTQPITGTISAKLDGDNDPAFRPVADWQDKFLAMQRDSLSAEAKAAGTQPRRDAWSGGMTRDTEAANTIAVDFAYSVDPWAFKPAAPGTTAGNPGGPR